MKWVVTADEMRSIDSRTIEKIGIPGSTLMERAGLEVMAAISDRYGSVDGRSVIVLCGKGNNGGDGFVVAREMKRRGADVRVYVFGKAEDLKGETAVNYSILRQMKVNISHIGAQSGIGRIPNEADIVVDALLGTGIHGEVHGILRDAIRKINEMDGFVVSVDLPSGLDADNGTFVGDCVLADLTVTMGLLKRGLLLHPGQSFAGDIHIADIGFPERGISPEKVKTFLIEEDDVRVLLPERQPYFYKGDCGRVLIVAGSPGMTGAAAMTALGALRAGAGMTLLGIPRGLNPVLEQKLTETMTLPLPETKGGSLSLDAETEIMNALVWADVLAIGPGCGRNDETIELIQRIVKQAPMPVVIDADGLYAIAQDTSILKEREYNTVITPHQGELSRMLPEKDRPRIENDRIELVREYAKKWRTAILLKGAPSLVSADRQDVYINPTGNAGMATSGSGDVLTGIIAGLIGQGLDLAAAGIAGAYLHGWAGDIAAGELGETGMIAGDMIDALPYAIEDIRGTFHNDDHEHEE